MAISGNQWKVWSKHAWLHAMQVLMREAINGNQWQSVEGVVQTRLVACNASVDALRRARLCLIEQERIREEGARHRDEIGISLGQNLLGDLGRIDAVRRHERDPDPVGILAQLPRYPTATATWHAGSAGIIRDHQGSSGIIRVDEGSSPEAATWHARGDRGHARLVPPDARVDDVRT